MKIFKANKMKMETARYILFYYFTKQPMSEEILKKTINNSVSKIFGINGSLLMGLYLSWSHNSFPLLIIRIANGMIDEFYSCLFFQRQINFIPIKTFGTIKKAKLYADNLNPEKIAKDLSIEQ